MMNIGLSADYDADELDHENQEPSDIVEICITDSKLFKVYNMTIINAIDVYPHLRVFTHYGFFTVPDSGIIVVEFEEAASMDDVFYQGKLLGFELKMPVGTILTPLYLTGIENRFVTANTIITDQYRNGRICIEYDDEGFVVHSYH